MAFNGCSSLTSVILPDSVTRIDGSAFSRCSSLTTITLPDIVPSIGLVAFDSTPWLEAKRSENPLVIVNGVLIDGYTCTGDVIIPDGVTSIVEGAFNGCSSLTSITIPDSVTSIGEYAFNYCKSLSAITIPDSVTSIRARAFDGCSSLTSITIPDGVTSIGDYAFSNCENLTSITIPDGVTRISCGAFCSCDSLISITINNPECEIIGFGDTIPKMATIYGYNGSAAQAYAEIYDIKFVSLGVGQTTTTATTTVTTAPPATTTTPVETPDNYLAGDANCDGKVTIADATAILQSIGNYDKYGLSEQGAKNGDVSGNGDGITSADAIAIKRYDAGLIETLPEK